MPELGVPFVLTGPDGTRAVFNDPTDPDWVGYLDAENGITGLLDTADVREGFYDHVEGDGGVQTNSFLSRRIGTLQGIIIPDPDMATYNIRESKLKRASRGLRAAGPSVLTWTPSGSVQRQMILYRQGKVATTGRRPKTFVVPMSSPNAFVYSASTASIVVTPLGPGGDQGFTNPMTNPITTAYNTSGQNFVVNQGDADTQPLMVIQGPITNPVLRNNTTGKQWTLVMSLSSTDVVQVDTQLRTVLLNGSSVYSAYAANFAGNTWWSLAPGSNDIRLLNSAFSAGAQVTLYWQHAWE